MLLEKRFFSKFSLSVLNLKKVMNNKWKNKLNHLPQSTAVKNSGTKVIKTSDIGNKFLRAHGYINKGSIARVKYVKYNLI